MSFLLPSIDLEDVRDWVDNGMGYSERVPANTQCYLDYFERLDVKVTFFVVGRVARRYPDLIKKIKDKGHEIACHGDMHIQLDKLSIAVFREDLKRNIQSLMDLGAENIIGFRAPTFSLTAETAWAYDVLSEAGIKYSSSVLPARNPLYGWPEFGFDPKLVNDTLWEIPMSLHTFPGLRVPIIGGVYFRVLPFFLTRLSVWLNVRKKNAVGTYLHPYDIDTGQERFMHPDLGEKKYLNVLMYIKREKVLKRLEKLHELYGFCLYRDYVDLLKKEPATSSASGFS
jgi:polysaccharide deacetylase family protein (PEP-CTERM system associated)